MTPTEEQIRREERERAVRICEEYEEYADNAQQEAAARELAKRIGADK